MNSNYWEAENRTTRAEVRRERQPGCMVTTAFVYVVDKATGKETGPLDLNGRTKELVNRIAAGYSVALK